MYLITTNTYKPIKKFLNAISNENNNFDSEFDFALDRFNYLAKQNSYNYNMINKFKITAKEKFILDLLAGAVNPNEVDSHLSEYGIEKNCDELVVILIEYTDYNSLVQNISRGGSNEALYRRKLHQRHFLIGYIRAF